MFKEKQIIELLADIDKKLSTLLVLNKSKKIKKGDNE